MLKALKTPLRYPGGKSRATRYLHRHIPERMTEFVEPFLGGGSMAIHMTKLNPDLPIWVNDKYYNLYCFWKVLQNDTDQLFEKLIEKKDIAMCFIDQAQSHRELFIQCKEELKDQALEEDPFEIAWRFYILNKCSFSGLGESSGFSKSASQQNFSYSNIRKLPAFGGMIQHWDITNLDYTHVLGACKKESFVFLDPPYDIESFLYGRKGNMHSTFDHQDFRDQVSVCEAQMMITYNSNDKLKEMFSSWNQQEWDLTYTMHSSKVYRSHEANRKELLLTNYKNSANTLEDFYEKDAPTKDSNVSKVGDLANDTREV